MQRLPLVIVVRANWDAQCGFKGLVVASWWKLVPTLGPNQLIASAIPVVIFFGVSGCVSLSAHVAGSIMCSFGLFVCLFVDEHISFDLKEAGSLSPLILIRHHRRHKSITDDRVAHVASYPHPRPIFGHKPFFICNWQLCPTYHQHASCSETQVDLDSLGFEPNITPQIRWEFSFAWQEWVKMEHILAFTSSKCSDIFCSPLQRCLVLWGMLSRDQNRSQQLLSLPGSKNFLLIKSNS